MRASRASRVLLFVLAVSTFGAASRAALATCNPLERTNLYVGDTVTDAQCNYQTIQDAIDAVQCPNTWIILTGEATYNDEHLTVNNHSFTLAGGGVAQCGDTPPVCDPTTGCGSGGAPPLTTIGGHGGDSVIHFEGESNVFLYNLDITGGNAGSDGSGGGLFFEGTGNLYLNNVTVDNNEAGYGGGIDISPSGGPATLTLQQNTLVIANTADTSGGGIRIEGDTRLFVLEPNTLIGFNEANGAASDGYGGGVEVIGPARADIASSGYGVGGVVSNNFAEYGGGIAAVAIHDSDDAHVRLFSVDANNPVRISDNGASHSGGGFYEKPYTSFLQRANAQICAQDFLIDNNQAVEGAALYLDENQGSGFDIAGESVAELNIPDETGFSCIVPEPPSDLGAVPCAPGIPCNEMSDNVAADTNGTPTTGSTILLQTATIFHGDRFAMRSNQGAHAIRQVADEDFSLQIGNCLIAGNNVTDDLLIATDDSAEFATIAVNGCTMAGNQIGGTYVINAASVPLTLWNSIIDQPGSSALGFSGINTDLSVEYVLSNDISAFPAGSPVIEGEPTFSDPAHGNYRLALTSLGVDSALATDGADLDGMPRTVDLPNVPNAYGPRDLGAYEIQLPCAGTDTLFCDGFDG